MRNYKQILNFPIKEYIISNLEETWEVYQEDRQGVNKKSLWKPRVEDIINKFHNKYVIVEWYVKNGKALYVEIKCLLDGNVFKTLPSSFIKSKNPCRECFLTQRNEGHKKDFIEVWGEAYTYLEFKIEKSQTQVHILCNDCGHKWWSSINNHKRDHGCMPCFRASKFYTLAECEKIGKEKHGDKYEYLDVYTDEEGHRCLKLKCGDHGEFSVRLWAHMKGLGHCAKCITEIRTTIGYSKTVRLYTLEECVTKGNTIHNNKYKYIGVYRDEKGYNTLIIECPVHGVFHQQVRYHLGGRHGCHDCANCGTYTPKNAEKYKSQWLTEHLKVYTLYCFDRNSEETFYKIGVTKNRIQDRYFTYAVMPYEYKIIDIIETNMYDGTYLEQELHNKHHVYSYKPKKSFGGSAKECYSHIEHIDLTQVNFEELKVYSRKIKEKQKNESLQ